MEEKKKFEKLVWEDIDNARREYQSMRHSKAVDYDQELVKSPKAKTYLKRYNDLQKSVKDLEKEMEKGGFRVSSYGSERTIETCRSYEHPKAKIYSAETQKVSDNFEKMKRDYTIKIYASGIDEIINLFANLQKELQALMK